MILLKKRIFYYKIENKCIFVCGIFSSFGKIQQNWTEKFHNAHSRQQDKLFFSIFVPFVLPKCLYTQCNAPQQLLVREFAIEIGSEVLRKNIENISKDIVVG